MLFNSVFAFLVPFLPSYGLARILLPDFQNDFDFRIRFLCLNGAYKLSGALFFATYCS